MLVGTQGPDGLDVSPRGGVPGFVKVLDDSHLAIPDLSGNNLLDTMTNVVRDGRVGLLFAVPGKVPLYAEQADDMPAIAEDGRIVGIRIASAERSLFFIPGCAAMSPRLAARLRSQDGEA